MQPKGEVIDGHIANFGYVRMNVGEWMGRKNKEHANILRYLSRACRKVVCSSNLVMFNKNILGRHKERLRMQTVARS